MRKFNVNEYYVRILEQGSPQNMIIVVKVAEEYDIEKFQIALHQEAEIQPMLNVSFSASSFCFIPKEKEITQNIIKTTKEWTIFVENELRKKFNSGDSLLRTTFINNPKAKYIIFCFHHIIADAVSGINFILNVFRRYYEWVPRSNCIIPKLELFPDNIPFYPDERRIGSVITPASQTKIDGFVLTNNIANIIKKINVTVTAYLTSCIMLSMQEVFHTALTEFIIATDLRDNEKNRKNEPLQLFASCLSIGPLKNNYSDKKILANLFNLEIKKQLEAGYSWNSRSDLYRIIKGRKSDNYFAKQFISNSSRVFVSNCGDTKIPKIDNLPIISELYIFVNCQSYMGTDDSFTIQVTSLDKKKSFCSISYPDPIVKEEKIKEFKRSLK